MDLNVQATSLGGGTANPLTVTFSDDFFGPVNGTLQAQLSGHTVSGGTSGTVNYNTFYSTANTIPATTPLTASGTLVGPTYASVQTGSINAGSFSLSQVVKISQSPAASYSLDASLSGVPDGGTTVMLLGAAVSGLAFLRRKSA
jgi:hypothetical protein